MVIKKIDHLGIAVEDHEAAKDVFEDLLGLSCEHVEEVPSQKVRTAFYPCADVNLELLESTGHDGPVGVFLDKRGEGFHHVAFEVDDIESELARLKDAGVRLIDQSPRPGAHGTRIAFLHPKATRGLLVELVERPAA
jgi:methylmalonyl-CoA epimerase